MDDSQFTVMHPEALRLAVDSDTAAIARRLAAKASDNSPRDTGTLAAGYYMVRNGPASYSVRNDVPYWRFVEFGGEHGAAQPAMGRAIADERARLNGGAP